MTVSGELRCDVVVPVSDSAGPLSPTSLTRCHVNIVTPSLLDLQDLYSQSLIRAPDHTALHHRNSQTLSRLTFICHGWFRRLHLSV
jgi:hypothetical protein